MTINLAECIIVLFRTPSLFRLNVNIEIVLFIVLIAIPLWVLFFKEFVDYNITTKAVAAQTSRALHLAIDESKILGGVEYHISKNL
jgi:hypothetical protein